MNHTNKGNPISKLAETYDKYPVLKALLSLVPGWSAPDTLLQARAAEIRSARLRVFFDEIASGTVPLTEELVKTEDFLHCFTRTTKAVIETRRKEKIQLFGRLFNNSMSLGVVANPDEFELLLSITDELSCTEIAVLQAIEIYERKYYKNGRFSETHRPHEGKLQEVVEEKLNLQPNQLPDNELLGIVIRLNRTGCYSMMGWRQGPAIDCRLTDIYFKLKRLILESSDGLPNNHPPQSL